MVVWPFAHNFWSFSLWFLCTKKISKEEFVAQIDSSNRYSVPMTEIVLDAVLSQLYQLLVACVWMTYYLNESCGKMLLTTSWQLVSVFSVRNFTFVVRFETDPHPFDKAQKWLRRFSRIWRLLPALACPDLNTGRTRGSYSRQFLDPLDPTLEPSVPGEFIFKDSTCVAMNSACGALE